MSVDAIAQVLDVAAVDARWQPTKARARMCLNTDLVLQIFSLEEDLRKAKAAEKANPDEGDAASSPRSVELAEQILALKAKADAESVEFVFASIGRKAYTDLLAAHRPTQEQQAQAKAGGLLLSFNPDTFPPKLMAASCVNPTGSSEDWWQRKYDEWAPGQITRVFDACLAAHEGVNDVPKATLASLVISGSAPSST